MNYRVNRVDDLYHYNHNHDELGRFAKSANYINRGGNPTVKVYRQNDNSNGNSNKSRKSKSGKTNGKNGGKKKPPEKVKGEQNYSPINKLNKNYSDFSKNASDATSTLSKHITRKQTRKKMNLDLSGMDDAQLKREINRIKMEREYENLVNPKVVSKGRQRAADFLDTTTTMLKVSGSVVAAGAALYKMRYWL